MSFPKQVQDAEARSEAMIAAATAPKNTPDPAAQPAAAPEPAAPPAPAAAPAAEDESTWKQRYMVLNGKYRAEIPRLTAKIDGLEQAIAELRAAPVTPAPTAPVNTTGITDADRAAFNPDVIDLVDRASKAAAAAAVAPVVAETTETRKEREERIAAEKRKVAIAEFYEAVEDLVEDWEAIEKMPVFQVFMASPHPDNDGSIWQDKINDAGKRLDAAAVARVFAHFKRTPEYRKHVASTQQPAPGAAGVPAAPNPLAHLEVPGNAGRTPADPAKRFYTKAEVAAFYKDRATGKYGTDEAAIDEIERDIIAASQEGRVR